MTEAEQHSGQDVRGLQESKGRTTAGGLPYEVAEPRQHGHDEKRQHGLSSDSTVVCELHHDERRKAEGVEGYDEARRAENDARGKSRVNFAAEQSTAQDRSRMGGRG